MHDVSMAKDIIAFVGPSGSGKTTLMLSLLTILPDRVAVCMSMTTRPPRGSDAHDSMYRFTTPGDFAQRIANGEFIHHVQHAGNAYGTLRTDADAALATKYAVGAFVEQGVINLRTSGYTVRVVKLRPIGHTPNDPRRAVEDAARDAMDVRPELLLLNNFAPGGRERAVEELVEWALQLPWEGAGPAHHGKEICS